MGARAGTSRRNAGTNRLTMRTSTAAPAPARARGWIPRPRPSRASEANPAATRPRQRVTSMRSPANPSRAGRRVTEATIVAATVTEAAMPRPEMNARPISSMPSRETTTVMPAKTTARPAVSIARTTASSLE